MDDCVCGTWDIGNMLPHEIDKPLRGDDGASVHNIPGANDRTCVTESNQSPLWPVVVAYCNRHPPAAACGFFLSHMSKTLL